MCAVGYMCLWTWELSKKLYWFCHSLSACQHATCCVVICVKTDEHCQASWYNWFARHQTACLRWPLWNRVMRQTLMTSMVCQRGVSPPSELLNPLIHSHEVVGPRQSGNCTSLPCPSVNNLVSMITPECLEWKQHDVTRNNETHKWSDSTLVKGQRSGYLVCPRNYFHTLNDAFRWHYTDSRLYTCDQPNTVGYFLTSLKSWGSKMECQGHSMSNVVWYIHSYSTRWLAINFTSSLSVNSLFKYYCVQLWKTIYFIISRVTCCWNQLFYVCFFVVYTSDYILSA